VTAPLAECLPREETCLGESRRLLIPRSWNPLRWHAARIMPIYDTGSRGETVMITSASTVLVSNATGDTLNTQKDMQYGVNHMKVSYGY